MRKSILALALCLMSVCVFAQEKSAKTIIPYRSFIAEVGGPGALFSVNYDTRFKKEQFGFGARVGIGFTTGSRYFTIAQPGGGGFSTNYKDVSPLTIPIQLNYIFGRPDSKSALEVGAGATYIGKYSDMFYYYGEENSKAKILGNTSFMYRRMPTGGGFSWRVGFTPLIGNGVIYPSGAASVGFNF